MTAAKTPARTLLARFLGRYVGRFWLAAVFLFLYAPLFFLIIFSFNSTRQDGVFTGFSWRWYEALLADSRLMEGFSLSLKVALITGTLSMILGTFAAFVLVRYARFKGRALFSGMVNAPLVMPEVIIGLSLLLLMVSVQRALGWPERGLDHRSGPHAAGHGLCHCRHPVAPVGDGPVHRRGRHGSRLPPDAGVFSGDPAQYVPGAGGGVAADVHTVV